MNIIEFTVAEEYYHLKEDFPVPTKVNMPEWYKKLEHGHQDENLTIQRTIKGCMPFLDTLVSGYCLKLPVDYKIEFGVKNDDEGNPIVKLTTSIDEVGATPILKAKGINIPGPGMHTSDQVKGSPFIQKNGGEKMPFLKINNPWRIKTPKGYSCLFVNPMNNKPQDYFEIIPAIVQTDTYNFQEINFPIIMNYEKHKNVNVTLQKGLPYVQIIPFKRDDWQMVVKPIKNIEKHKASFWNLQFLNRYKNMFWKGNKSKWI
jgi:hypothetical protein